MSEPLLQVTSLVKRFEGVLATDDLTLDVAIGELHAVIGPNGAGKTTLIGQVGGQIGPDSGGIHFAGRDMTTLPVHRRSSLGLARTFQIVSLFEPHRPRQCSAGGSGTRWTFLSFLAPCTHRPGITRTGASGTCSDWSWSARQLAGIHTESWRAPSA